MAATVGRGNQEGAVGGQALTGAGKPGRIVGWAADGLVCAWIAWCTAVGPIFRSEGSIRQFGPSNWAILLLVFAACLALTLVAARWMRGASFPLRGLASRRIRQTGRRRGEGRDEVSGLYGRSGPGRPGWLDALGGFLVRHTGDWRAITMVLVVGWLWIYVTLLAAFGADLNSQSREFATWICQLEGGHPPYRDGFTPMDVYPTARYLWPIEPTFLTDHHNIALTFLYGGTIFLSKRLTGSGDWGIILLAGMQLLFAAFCCGTAADRFLNSHSPATPPVRPLSAGTGRAAAAVRGVRHHTAAGSDGMSPGGSGPLARGLILLFFLVCPLSVFSTISLTKSTLFAFAFVWWFGIWHELGIGPRPADGSRGDGAPDGRRRPRLTTLAGFALSTLVMLMSAKYAVYIVAVQFILALLTDHRRWKTYVVCLLLPLAAFQGALSGLEYSGLVIPGDPIEGRSLQLQQVARTARDQASAIPEDARQALSPIMDLRAAGEEYTPNEADRVKSSGLETKTTVYKWKTVTAADMKRLDRAWLEVGRRAPLTYLDAFMAESYGYFDVGDPAYVPVAYYLNNGFVQDDTDHIGHWCHGWRDAVAGFVRTWTAIPVLGWPAKGNFWVVCALLLIGAQMAAGSWRGLVGQFPLLLMMGVMILSPANNFERHMLPVAFVVGFVLLSLVRGRKTLAGCESLGRVAGRH
ncbi:DUF6020 family protein [Bifidobacterium favimelis]|uniref:DUF6020 family protein n=1 Tax=Bifidobacterium favimelis TaxID=3122979 RepID=A0ABU8ZLJ2_9BIFI